MVNKYELKYLVYATVFAIVHFGFLQPYLISQGIENSSPYLQFLVFNVGLFVFFQIFLKVATLRTSVSVQLAVGFILLFTALDVLAPPFAVSHSGVLAESGTLIRSSSDYVLGYFATNTIHLSGVMVYIFTYIISPFVLLFAAAKLIPNFVKSL